MTKPKTKSVSKFAPESFEPFTPEHWLAERNIALESIERLLCEHSAATQNDQEGMSDPVEMFTRLVGDSIM